MIKKMLITVALMLACSTVFAQHYDDHDTHHSKHHIAIFDGATTNFGHSTTGYALGLDYEYLISDRIGIGAIGEYVFSGEGELILGVPLFLHLTNGLKLGAAPIGIYVEEHHDDHHNDTHGVTNNNVEKKWDVGARFNLAYGLHFGKISAGPSVSLDIANTTAIAYGLSLGVGF